MRFRLLAALLGAASLGLLAINASPAGAAGVTRVEQTDGSVQLYPDVTMRLHGETLWIRSADHKAVLEIKTAACTFAGELKRCYPAAFTLHKNDGAYPIPLAWGTVYLNLTNASQTLPLSSKQIPAQSLMISMRTERGTFISVHGSIDEVTQ